MIIQITSFKEYYSALMDHISAAATCQHTVMDNIMNCKCTDCKCADLEARIAELEAFVEKAMANPMIAGMLS